MAAEIIPRHPDLTDEEYLKLLIEQYNNICK